MTHKNANNLVERLRDTIARSLGALLVCRRVQADPARCPELAALLDQWDGKFTVLMRKRTARHIDGCSVCEEQRARMVTPAALLGATPVVIPAPAWLRDATLSRAPLTGPAGNAPSETWWPPSDFDGSDRADTPNIDGTTRTRVRGRARAGLGAGLILIGIAGGALLARPSSLLVVPTDAPATRTSDTAVVTTTPSIAQRPAPTTTASVAPPAAVSSTPDFTAPPVTGTNPAEPTAVPRTEPPPPTSEEPPPSRFEPSPVNPQPQQPEPDIEEPDNGPSEPPVKKVVPPVEQVPPPDKSNNQCPPVCIPGVLLIVGYFFFGSSTSVPTNGTRASGTRTLPSGCWWFSRIATSQRVVASVPLSVAAVCGLPFSSR